MSRNHGLRASNSVSNRGIKWFSCNPAVDCTDSVWSREILESHASIPAVIGVCNLSSNSDSIRRVVNERTGHCFQSVRNGRLVIFVGEEYRDRCLAQSLQLPQQPVLTGTLIICQLCQTMWVIRADRSPLTNAAKNKPPICFPALEYSHQRETRCMVKGWLSFYSRD